MFSKDLRVVLLTALTGCSIGACGAATPAGPDKYRGPGEKVDSPNGAKYQCSNVGGSDDPYLVEWDGSTKGAKVEGPAKDGVLLVKYQSCTGEQTTANLEVLDGCEIRPSSADIAAYRPMGIARKTETEKISNEADLYAKLKVGALELANEYGEGDIWSLDYVLSDTKQSFVREIGRSSLSGRCAEATHFVEKLSVGAYRLHRTAHVKADGKVEFFKQGVGYDYQSSALNVRTDGMYDVCMSDASYRTNPDCQAIVRVFLKPIEEAGVQPAAEPEPVNPSEEPAVAEPESNWFTSGCGPSPTGRGGPMCHVPAGEFLMGCNPNADKECSSQSDEGKSPRRVYLDAYYLDRHEVTVKEYAACVDANACGTDGLAMPFWKAPGEDAAKDKPDWAWACNWNKKGQESHPINCIPFRYAEAYCRWAGKQLPTEAEWEKGARGTDGWKYPWGNRDYSSVKMVANIADETAKKKYSDWTTAEGYEDGYTVTAPVEHYPNGKSPYGLYDMIGNLWEWVRDWYDAGYYSKAPLRNPENTSASDFRVLRGGSWFNLPSYARASYRGRIEPGRRSGDIGFRCAASPAQ